MENTIFVGDRVKAFYREHSIPTYGIGTVYKIEGDWITVELDPRFKLESGNLVRVRHTEIYSVNDRNQITQ